MKISNFLKISFLSLSFMTVCTACPSDDDDDIIDPSIPENSETFDIDGTHLTQLDEYNYIYDNKGRVVSCYWIYQGDALDDPILAIDYTNGKILLDDIVGNVKFNSNGYISHIDGKYEYGEDYNTYKDTGSESADFSYDGEGHITQITYSGKYKYGYNGHVETYIVSGKATFNWKNGNLISYKNETSETSDGETDRWTEEESWKYSSTLNKFKQYGRVYDEIDFMDDFNVLMYVGLIGKGSTNLPCEFEDGDPVTYTLNENGSIRYENLDGRISYYTYSPINTSAQSYIAPVATKKAAKRPSHSLFKRHFHK